MAIVKPFRAIRPDWDKAHLVASRSYGDYPREELQQLLRDNPLSFLQIIYSGRSSAEQEIGGERYLGVRERFLKFLEQGIFLRDGKPGFYLYGTERDGLGSLGLFCACSLSDYRSGIIKKHEETLVVREQGFANYLYRAGFNAEPVLMAFSDPGQIQEIFEKIAERAPDCRFMDPEGSRHSLWKVDDPWELEELEITFGGLGSLYIADGHHRCASSNLVALQRAAREGAHSGCEPYNYFMACLVPESQIRIQGYNRMVRDLNGLDKATFLQALEVNFTVTQHSGTFSGPMAKHSFGMYLEGDFYSLYLRGEHRFEDPLEALDVQILQRTVLRPILGITDPRKGDRISFIHGKDNLKQMQDKIDRGDFAVGFALLPPAMGDIKALADAGAVMPPKSTYIEPKPICGLAIYEL